MVQEIDFLAAAKKKGPSKAEASRWLKLGSISLLALYCLLVGAVFFYSVYLRAETKKVGEQIADKRETIESFKKVETLQTILKERLSGLNKLFSLPKTDYPQLLTYFEQEPPEGIILEEINFGADQEISISGLAVNSLVWSSFLENLNDPGQTSLFSQISLSSVSRQDDGAYNFNLAFELNEKR